MKFHSSPLPCTALHFTSLQDTYLYHNFGSEINPLGMAFLQKLTVALRIPNLCYHRKSTRIRRHAVCWSCVIFSDPLQKNPTPRCMLILCDLFCSITQETDTKLYVEPVWSFLIHYTRTRNHAVCWSCLTLSDPLRTFLSYLFNFHLSTFSHIYLGLPSHIFLQIILSKIRMHCPSMRATCPDSHVSCFDNSSDIIKIHTVHCTAASSNKSGRPVLRHS
jgi:hypothetical protein